MRRYKLNSGTKVQGIIYVTKDLKFGCIDEDDAPEDVKEFVASGCVKHLNETQEI